MTLEELKKMGAEVQKNNQTYEQQVRLFLAEAKPLEPEVFTKILNEYRKLVLYALMNDREPTKWAADEIMRASVTKQNGIDFSLFPGFIASYNKLVKTIYNKLDNADLGRGDDSFGDLCDNLPLMGVPFVVAFRNEQELMETLRNECSAYIDQWKKIPWNNHGGKDCEDLDIVKKWISFIAEGENYNQMMLKEAWAKWFAHQGYKEVNEFESFLTEATNLVVQCWGKEVSPTLVKDSLRKVFSQLK